MMDLNGCQLPCLPRIAEGIAELDSQPLKTRIKRKLAKPWNYSIKKRLKKGFRLIQNWKSKFLSNTHTPVLLTSHTGIDCIKVGDWVHVRSKEEIQATLDRWNESHGCAFLENMWQYCGSTQQVLQVMERFLDERDYKVKKVRGIVLLKDVICQGTPVFGRCDRCCHLFWRVEWLEKIDHE